MPAPQRFTWSLTQERVDMIAGALYKLETILNISSPGSLAAEDTGRLITDLRANCCQRDGAADPFLCMPMFPSFDDTVIQPDPLWRDSERESEAA